jgi:hypothetical protein
MTDVSRRPDELLLDELTDQLERTRALLSGNPEAVAARALERMGSEDEMEARLAAELAVAVPLAAPERFPEAHRLAMRALEVLDREGTRPPDVPKLGPVGPIAGLVVGFVVKFIVKAYAGAIANRLRVLYHRREAQCPPELPERKLLARARMEMDRLAPDYRSGVLGPLTLVASGAALSLLASVARSAGALEFSSDAVQLAILAVAFVLFFVVSWVLLRGAAIAHRRSSLIMQQPLLALWETIGNAGPPPQDQSKTFATIAVVLTAVVWFVLPATAAVVFLVFN